MLLIASFMAIHAQSSQCYLDLWTEESSVVRSGAVAESWDRVAFHGNVLRPEGHQGRGSLDLEVTKQEQSVCYSVGGARPSLRFPAGCIIKPH